MDEIINTVKKEQVDTFFNHLHSVDPHIKLTMETPGNDGSIPSLHTKCSSNSHHTTIIATYIGTLTIKFQARKQ